VERLGGTSPAYEKDLLRDENDIVTAHFRRSCQSLERAARDVSLRAAIYAIADAITRAFRNNGKLLIAGNGGSAADAQHIAGEFLARLNFDRHPLPAIALSTDTSVLTAIGNDYGFEQVFERQVRGLGRPGDVFLAISTSGRSPNVLTALKAAREIGMTTIGFTGDGRRDMSAHVGRDAARSADPHCGRAFYLRPGGTRFVWRAGGRVFRLNVIHRTIRGSRWRVEFACVRVASSGLPTVHAQSQVDFGGSRHESTNSAPMTGAKINATNRHITLLQRAYRCDQARSTCGTNDALIRQAANLSGGDRNWRRQDYP
jgi:D-sedoheptulose 7-phosphate isomerase